MHTHTHIQTHLHKHVHTHIHTAPSPVQNLQLKRTPNNDTLVAFWTLVVATPPVGRVVHYEIQFRDQRVNAITNSVIQPPAFDYTVLHPVVNASSYEVRVRASVEIQRDPVAYESSSWTEWESVSRVIDPTDGKSAATCSRGEGGESVTLALRGRE